MQPPSSPSSTNNEQSLEQPTLTKVTPAAYMSLVILEWFISRWWIPAIPVAAVYCLARWADPRFWFVLPIVVCLVLPPIIGIIIYSYALTPEGVAAVRPHRVDEHPDGSLTLSFDPDPETGRTYSPLHVSVAEIKSVEERADRRIVHLKDKPFRFIILPNKQENDV